MYYAKLCIFCSTPYTTVSKNSMFCCRKCRLAYYKHLRERPQLVKHDKVYEQLKKEIATGKSAKCYKCGKPIENWNFDWYYKYGKVCKNCVTKQFKNRLYK
jgi:hypothetical protein